MLLYQNLLHSALTMTMPLLLPAVSRLSVKQLTRMIPSLPVRNHPLGKNLREIVEKDPAYINFIRHISQRTSRSFMKSRIELYIVNAVVMSRLKRREAQKKFSIPGIGSMVITPGVECNLNCELCYNKHHFRPEDQLSLHTMDSVVEQGKDVGAYRVTIIGGEPLLRWKEICSLAEKNRDVLFTVLTNGTLLTREIAQTFAGLGNVEFCFSIDGFEETNDEWRGDGTFAQVIRAMEYYRDADGMVSFTPTITSENFFEVLSDDFIDLMIDKGAYMGYYHHYYLLGGQERTDLLLSEEQFKTMAKRIEEIVTNRPILLFDNVLSTIFQGGCQAVREYIHINHRGEVEPCCMVPFAVDNIHDKSLVEILKSPFFSSLKEIGKDSKGIKRCMIGPNSESLEQCVKRECAFDTTPRALDIFSDERTEVRSQMPTCFSRECVK